MKINKGNSKRHKTRLEVVAEFNLELMIHSTVTADVRRVATAESRLPLRGLHAERGLRDHIAGEVTADVIRHALRAFDADTLIRIAHLRDNREVNRRVNRPAVIKRLGGSGRHANRELDKRCSVRLIFKDFAPSNFVSNVP